VAHSLSAKKRIRQNARKRTLNRARRSQVKTQIKHLETVLSQGNVAAAEEQFKLVVRKLDKVASTSTMHKRTAARKKSRLARRVNALKAKVGAGPQPS
jgi:small subunit ribosomal protein S20